MEWRLSWSCDQDHLYKFLFHALRGFCGSFLLLMFRVCHALLVVAAYSKNVHLACGHLLGKG